MPYLLGIDIGTTKTACVVLRSATGKIAHCGSIVHGAETAPGIQDARKHLDCIRRLLEEIPAELRSQISRIGVTGQMHGAVLWKDDLSKVSPLYTWQSTVSDLDAIQKICPALRHGFGITSLASLAKTSDLNEYDHAGTIMDFLVWRMTGKLVMDPCNAASWGAFDLMRNQFDDATLKRLGIPRKLMPEVVPCETCAGIILHDVWTGLPANLPVMAATGDNQASVFATARQAEDEVYLTLGTGAQLSCIIPEINPALECRPYPGGRFLAVAAPLCGGAAWAWLEKHVKAWHLELTGHDIEDAALYTLIDRLAQRAMNDNDLPVVLPHFLGERSNPALRGQIEGITLNNYTPDKLAAALALGIIRNLWDAMPAEVVRGRTRLMASGNAIRRTAALQQACVKVTGLNPIPVDQKEEAACGAALMSQNMKA